MRPDNDRLPQLGFQARKPIILGLPNARIDWSAFEDECKRTLGRVPARGERLCPAEWMRLGYSMAGRGIG